MEKEGIFFTLIILVGFFVFVAFSLSSYYNWAGSIAIIIFFALLAILVLKKAVKKEYASKESAEEKIKEVLSPSLKKEKEKNINYLTIVTLFSLVIGLIAGLCVQQFIPQLIPIHTYVAIGVGIFVTVVIFCFFVWLRMKKLDKKNS